MCGILSYYKKEGLSKDDIVEAIHSLGSINHRGPDGEGVCLINTKTKQIVSLRTSLTPTDFKCDVNLLGDIEDGKFDLLFGHKRLSIFDLTSAGHQPMIFEDGFVIIFNGEVYNFYELKEELKHKGYVFKSQSDTEVILRAYQEWGETCLNKFNGMWAIVIYDSKKNKLFISRDRFGVKPLYIFNNNKILIFVSEIKQFLSFKNQYLTINRGSIKSFIENGLLDHNNSTFYNEVSRYNSGFYSSYFFDDHKMKDKEYYVLPSKIIKIKEKEAFEEYRRLFGLAVLRRMRSDVKIGVSISGGVDSSAILYKTVELLKESGKKVNAFSAIFPGMEGDESNFVKIIENDLKEKINVFYTNPYEEFNIHDFEKHIYHQDFPTDSSSNYAEWSLARLVKKNGVTVLLAGQGGDEVFAGYHQHFYKYCRQLILSGNILKYLSIAKKYAELKSISINKLHLIVIGEIKTSIAFKLGLKKFSNRIDTEWLKANKLIEALTLDTSIFQLPWYLRSDDRDFMAFGVETRHPFLDVDLVNFGYELPDEFKIRDGWQKWIVRQNMDDVPNNIRFRKDKKGYTTPQDKFNTSYNDDLIKHQINVNNLFPNSVKSFSFRLSSLGIWLGQNNILKERKTSEINAIKKECSRCILNIFDTHEISFDSFGICNYCNYYDKIYNNEVIKIKDRELSIELLLKKIKKKSKGKNYDCVIGVSGGVDSTYVAYFVKKFLGLNPLAVHLDYGWNSDMAVSNINKTLQLLNIDLYTHVVNWEEIKDLQLSFLKASVVDIELVNDFAIAATVFNIAEKYGIKYILHGGNIQTEGGKLPKGWTWAKYDQLNVFGIQKQFGSVKLKTYPRLPFWKKTYLTMLYKMEFIGILNYIEYNRDTIKKFIIEELGWEDYGGKHFESVFTRFYQGYILPKKFNINKQKFHFSVLICSGQITKEQAEQELKLDYYTDDRCKEDMEYVLKKLGISEETFNEYMKLPIKKHSDYPTYTKKHYKRQQQFINLILPVVRLKRKILKKS